MDVLLPPPAEADFFYYRVKSWTMVNLKGSLGRSDLWRRKVQEERAAAQHETQKKL